MTEEQHLELASRNEIFDIELPKFEFKVDPSEAYLDQPQNTIADSATTNIKALVAVNEEDQRFVYKKADNWVILVFRVALLPGYNIDKHEIVFGF